ncbi:MAG TPA: hypothetical protein DDZ41_08515, partial [Flavobacterium sp.]|nr:hypothetical protein [Flavobacterium sp.]
GQGATNYAPVMVQSANPVVAFYKATNPLTDNPGTIATSVGQISTTEYWGIDGVSSIISLSWRSTTVTGFTSSDYTIVGFNSGSSTWELIPSTIDATSFLGGASTVSAGSIKSNAAVNLATYKFFTIGTKGIDSCPPVIAVSSGNTKTWNGSWSPSAPTENDPVVISTAGAPGSFACFSLNLLADVTLTDGQFIDCVNNVTGSGNVILSSRASFVQRNPSATAPNIVFNKYSQDMRRYDYTYRGHPVTGDTFSQTANARAINAGGTPISTESAFDLFYQYNSGTGGGWGSVNSTTPGRGFISRVSPIFPFVDAVTTSKIVMPVTGVANNGSITVPIQKDETLPDGYTSYNLLSNPYPSALNGDKFLAENVSVDGALYIYTSATAFPGTGSYSQNDFIVYTRLGATFPNGLGTFDGNISSAQGFQVKALNDGNVTFTNCMRLTNNNLNFYKNQNSENSAATIDKFKLRLTGDNGVYNELIVGYLKEGTLGYDRMYDATASSISTAQLYTIMDNSDKNLAINARPIFANNDKVTLGFKKSNSDKETFSIEITDKHGIFNTSAVNVYLYDKLLDAYHNLNESNFIYTTNEELVNDRFEIVYKKVSLDSDENFSNTAVIVLNDNNLSIKASDAIKEVIVYDITGRIIENYQSINNNDFDSNFNHEESVYIARVVFNNGFVSSQKVIHTK